MREIKFRFWDGTHMTNEYGGWSEDIGTNEIFKCLESYGVEVMQFTGLKDKNGKEIYEGDIVGRRDGQVWTVEYDESRARFIAYNQLNSNRDIEESMTKTTMVSGMHKPVVIIPVTDEIEIEAEVIGNIHENPELLETPK